MKHSPLRIGFDLDGVILYNPARTLRPLVALFKRLILKKTKTEFYSPSRSITRLFWNFIHKSSIAPATGIDEIKKLVKEKKIEAFIVSARYNFLKVDFEKWLKEIGGKTYFKQSFYNKTNEQPHVYKAKIIRRLKLDIYIEDNWDIVKHLQNELNSATRVYWISNILDAGIDYPHKFFNLKDAMHTIKKKLV